MRIGIAPGVEEHVARGGLGRNLAIVDRNRLARPGEIDQHESAATQIAGDRVRDRERKADRDCRIDRVAASLQNVNADLRCQMLLARYRAVGGEHG